MRDPAHHLFFTRHVRDGEVILDKEETHHARAVLRLKTGDRFRATDGRGVIYECAVDDFSGGLCRGRVREVVSPPIVLPVLTLLVGIPGRDAAEALVRDCAVLGVARIVPVVSDNCRDRWWRGGWEKHGGRLERKMIAGLKQSLNPRLPDLSPPRDFKQVLGDLPGAEYVADPGGKVPGTISFPDGETPLRAWVGPPGGFTPEEERALGERKVVGIRLSRHRLRTETATLLLCATLLQPR